MSAPKDRQVTLRLPPVGEGIVKSFVIDGAVSQDFACVFERLPIEWQQHVRMHWFDSAKSFGSIIEAALEGLPEDATGPIVIEPIVTDYRWLFRATAEDRPDAPNYVLAWTYDAIELTWRNVTYHFAFVSHSDVATPYYWGLLPMMLQAEMAAQGWTPEAFQEVVDEAQTVAVESATFYGVPHIVIECFYSQRRDTLGAPRLVLTPGELNRIEARDLASLDPSRALKAALSPQEVTHACP
jgi:hypothetical protein